MEISFDELISYYKTYAYPRLNQVELITQKYQTFIKETAGLKGSLYLVGFDMGAVDEMPFWNIEGANFEQDSPETIEIQSFFTYFKQSRIGEYLESLGIQFDDFLFIYDYATMNSWFKKSSEKQPIFMFSKPRTYLVFFDESMYNLVRLTHKNSESMKLNFEPKIGYSDDARE